MLDWQHICRVAGEICRRCGEQGRGVQKLDDLCTSSVHYVQYHTRTLQGIICGLHFILLDDYIVDDTFWVRCSLLFVMYCFLLCNSEAIVQAEKLARQCDSTRRDHYSLIGCTY